ncbi:MAG: hypothetical protein ABIK37_02085 [candidate division WOR-3 bacterium]
MPHACPHRSLAARLACLLLALALPASAAEPTSELYDPENDIIGTGGARWVYIGTVVYQAPAWSILINTSFGLYRLENWNKALGVQLLATPAGFFGALWLTRNRPTTLGMAALSAAGSAYGMGAGFVAGDLLLNWGQQFGSFEPRALTALGGSIAGHVIGFQHADRERLNCGNAAMLSEAGAWSALYAGYLTSLPIPLEDLDIFPSRPGVPWQLKIIETGALAGWAGGLYLWHTRAPRNYTTGDAVSSGNCTWLSVLSGFAAYSLFFGEASLSDEWQVKGALLVPAVVNAAGLGYGWWFHRNRDVTFPHSILISFGSIVGATGIGTGTALLLSGEQGPDWRASLLAAAGGGWLGFHLSHILLKTGSPEYQAFRRDSKLRQVHLMPAGAAAAFLASRTGQSVRAPLFAMEF